MNKDTTQHSTEKVLLTFPVSDTEQALLEAAAPAAIFSYRKKSEITPEDVRSATVILGNIPVELLPKAKNLRWLQLESSGANSYTDPTILPKGAILTSATGAYSQSVAEHAFAMLFTLMKKLHLYRDNQNQHLWESRGTISTLEGKTVLIVGFGSIGTYFATMVRPMAGKIIGITQRGGSSEVADQIHTMEELDQLLPLADVVLLSLPDTPSTRGLLTRQRLSLLKETAILLNVGRGTVLDQEALCDLVEQGSIQAAGLDVVEPEPLPKGHRIWDTQNILLTPHSSGGRSLPQTQGRIVEICKENLERYVKGEPLNNVVSLSLGYVE